MTNINQAANLQQSLTPKEILRLLRRQLPDLVERYEIQYLGVFGSYVHGLANSESDLDILVDFDTPQHSSNSCAYKTNLAICWVYPSISS